MEQPGLYVKNNVTGTFNVLDAMRAASVDKLGFSSTAAVYGNPENTPIDEAHPTLPINPYGWSKLMAEQQIAEYCSAHGLRAACLRYFNAAGTDSEAEIGEAHDPETHLIPNLIKAALDPSRGPVNLFGNDYDTPDGTCVRDFIHVEDFCDAHLRALDHLETHADLHVFNLGTGGGQSVEEVLAACRQACDGAPEAVFVARREGDPPTLVTDNTSAARILQWQPSRTISRSVSDALAWHRTQGRV